MKIEITNQYTREGKEFYYWSMFTGPDGIDEVRGFASDLIEVFSKIVEWQERIALDYTEEPTKEQ
jgi:hypothetical protein